ncbi:protein adenylyltransferase SelO [Solibacillus cecembensis]|uniref:protein adenylyltransferase SelO n=1 Tax=Solibacillus cecembensis TaxID=459347 RepID=UPI003D065B92
MKSQTNENFGFHFDNSYLQLPHEFYSKVILDPVENPAILLLNRTLAKQLELDVDALFKEGAPILTGSQMPKEAAQIAQAYAGHQFGHFNMLGDGRALLIGEHVTKNNTRFDIQLKGAGRTPYSRGGDGRAALGPMLREFLISEAMFALHVPTTRSLAVTTTGEPIYREQVYEGAVLTRVASSHLRVGTFQYAASFCDRDSLTELADYAIMRHYPELMQSENRYLAFLEEVLDRQAALIANWQLIGFIHGVMNTDNMTISGETIDYGPCAFMDQYNRGTVFSSIDTQSRYAYGNQPQMAGWNIARFAESLLPLIHDDVDEAIQLAQKTIEQFSSIYEAYYYNGMREKLGMLTVEPEDEALVDELLALMEEFEADYTNTLRVLSENKQTNEAIFQSPKFMEWEQRWLTRISQQGTTLEEALQVMQSVNPIVIPRNHQVEQAIQTFVEGDTAPFMELLQVLTNPFHLQPEHQKYTQLPNDDAPPFVSYCGT